MKATELQRKANKQLIKLQSEESHIATLQAELATNPKFVEFLDAQKKLQKKTDEFWSKVKDQMVENDVKEINIDTDYVMGKLSVSYVKGYEAKDVTKVTKDFLTMVLDTKKVAQEVEKTGNLPKGVDEKGYYRLNKSLKSKDIVS